MVAWGGARGIVGIVLAAIAAIVVVPGAASQEPPPAPEPTPRWLPHAANSEWVYQWSDTMYSPDPWKEKVTVKAVTGRSFELAWTTKDLENKDEAPVSIGAMAFQETTFGLLNTNWASNAPPADFPILCARLAGCNNSMASTHYLLVWGSRAPVLLEPLLEQTRWSSTGGAEGDVTSTSEYLGREQVVVPAYADGVEAAKVRTEITQAGALGDPYGSGVRTVWWVFGVGPVKIVFEHAGGADASVTTSELVSTNLQVVPPPPDANHFPLEKGKKLRYRWTNTKHLKEPSIQEFVVDETLNNSARVSVKHVSGPIKVAGSYGFAVRTDGVNNIWGAAQAASLVTFPPLGPSTAPTARRRHFFTPFDLMVFGLNPILTAYPHSGETWSVKTPSRDFSVFGVTGTSKILGQRAVDVPAGRFSALAIQSTLRQKGFPFGSGTRTSYFTPRRGLVKILFRHADRSTSLVELLPPR